jgi:glycosyltransferase involved in cell wall biosynthesis
MVNSPDVSVVVPIFNGRVKLGLLCVVDSIRSLKIGNYFVNDASLY